VLLLFALTNSNADFALTLSIAMIFAGGGFYFMFFGRELFINIPLAQKRAERFLIENTHEAGAITIRLNTTLPTSVLIGVADADSLLKKDPDQASALKKDLMSEDVSQFLNQSSEAMKTGRPLDWDILSKVANLQYYRSYFVDKEKCHGQQELALLWVSRALVLNPDHVDLSVKHADLLALLRRYREAVAILEQLCSRPDCPYFVEQWLGFYLLYVPGREDSSQRCSESYLRRFPESNETLRNIASAYAQRACLEAAKSGRGLDTSSNDYKEALLKLQEVIRNNPSYLPTIQREWASKDGSYCCFSQDPGYLKLIQPSTTESAPINRTAPDPIHMTTGLTQVSTDRDE
jgi:tetratricopeptide (TPR) repeat protein